MTEQKQVSGSDRRRLGSMVSIRLAPDELDVIRIAAERQGLSVSAFIRAAALTAAAEEHENVRQVDLVDVAFPRPNIILAIATTPQRTPVSTMGAQEKRDNAV